MKAGKINDLYFDDDGEVGVITATMLNEPFSAPADDLMESIDRSECFFRIVLCAIDGSLRISPPHSLVDYTQKDLEYKPVGYPANVKPIVRRLSINQVRGSSPMESMFMSTLNYKFL